MPAAGALALGAVLALVAGNPHADLTRKATTPLLSLAIVGLGAGMDLGRVADAGARGIGYTVAGIALCFAVGTALSRALRVQRDTGLLITVGTAICGGSAIAAVVPVLRPRDHEVSVALATVFLLNAAALVLFPPLGHAARLDQGQFGLWAALAIHDTSSVVGAALQYGAKALEVATSVKLARALWIVPLTLAIGAWRRREGGEEQKGKARRPWFILGFVCAAALVTFVPVLQPAGHVVEQIARRGLVLTLFLIGANFTRDAVRTVGARPFAQGFVLWVVMATTSLAAVAFRAIG
jgi:uncharacterized integral membrane protein (TIGR00698 family)